MNHSPRTGSQPTIRQSRPRQSRPSSATGRPAPGAGRPRRAALQPDADRHRRDASSPARIATFELQGRWLKELVLFWWAHRGRCSPPRASLLLYAYHRSRRQGRRARAQWLRWLGIARARQRRQLGARRRRVLPLACRRAAGVPRVPVRRHGVGRHPGVRRFLADLRALRGGHPAARSSTCWPPSATGCSPRSRCWCRCST